MGNNKYSYVCLDLDGTLLDSSKQISGFNRDAILNLCMKGVTFLVATGRHLEETLAILREYGLNDSISFVVYADGSHVYDCNAQKIVSNTLLSFKDLWQLVELSNCKQFVFFNEDHDYEVVDKLSINTLIRTFFPIVQRKRKRIVYYSLCPLLHRRTPIEKVVFPIPCCLDLKALDDRGYYVLKTESLVEILPTNKCLSLKMLLDSLGVFSDEILYFGDDFNDKECFECFDSVVMGNALDGLKKYSIMVSKTNDEDGVGVALHELFESCFEQNHEC